MSAEIATLLEELVSGDVAEHEVKIIPQEQPATVVAQLLVEPTPEAVMASVVSSPPTIDTNLYVVDAPAPEGYLVIFDEIVGQLDTLGADAARIAAAGDQDGRLAAALGFIKNQQELNEKFYALMVEMSNFLPK